MSPTILAVLGLVLAAIPVAVAAQNFSLGTLPNGDNYIANRLIVAMRHNAPKLTIDKTFSGIATSGVESIDNLCKEIGVTRIEPFYRGRLTKPTLVREISRMYIFTLGDGLDAVELEAEFESDSNIDYVSLCMLPTLHY